MHPIPVFMSTVICNIKEESQPNSQFEKQQTAKSWVKLLLPSTYMDEIENTVRVYIGCTLYFAIFHDYF